MDRIVLTRRPKGVRPVVGWPEGYYIGRDGRLWSRRERRSAGRGKGSISVIGNRWKEIRGFRGNKDNPYPSVVIYINGRPSRKLIHTMVLEAFRGPRPPGMEGRHLDGDFQNCHVRNLRWGTSKQNHQDMIRHGRTTKGRKDNRGQAVVSVGCQ